MILVTSTAGTTISDYVDRTLGLGYATGLGILVAVLLTILGVWWLSRKSLLVNDIQSRRAELFYWATILFSNTLGMALGDYLADDSGLGFGGRAVLIGAVLAVVVARYYLTSISRVLLFWVAFVLIRPFRATFGDLLTKSL